MAGKAKFVHWLVSDFKEIPSAPMFNVISNDKGLTNHSTVSGETLLITYGIPVPLFPSLETWKTETAAKRKCFRCWTTVKGRADLMRHRTLRHHETFRVPPAGMRGFSYVPLLLLLLF